MNKRIVGGAILFLALMVAISLTWDNHLHTEEDLWRPNDFGSYRGYGYFKIDPKTILVSLENGNMNVFQPLLIDPNEIEEVTDMPISWGQEDFIQIFSALSKLVWDDSIDPKVWSIYDIDFSGGCFNEVCDLDSAQIVYFKITGKNYTTRILDIQPYFGLVRWGDGASYPQPILRKWKGAELATSKIAAEDALKIVEKNGGQNMRLKVSDKCAVYIYSSRFNQGSWNVNYRFGLPSYSFHVLVDLKTGKSKFLTANQ